MISNVAVNTPALVMLSSNCCQPCYTFEINNGKHFKLSSEDLKDVLLWAAKVQPTVTEVLFLAADDEPLDPSIASVLQDIADQVVTPLLSLDRQRALGIPFSRNQTVVARNLNEIVRQKDNIAGRPVILHVERSEISRLAKGLLAVQDFIGTIRLCLCEIHLLENQHLQTYEQQLAQIADTGLMKQAMGTEAKFRILNLSGDKSREDRSSRCPAGIGFITVGPDGFVYPCPAFYYAGREHSLGSINSITSEPANIKWESQQCGICGSTRCPGCPFLESSQIASKEQLCKVYEAENHANRDMLSRVALLPHRSKRRPVQRPDSLCPDIFCSSDQKTGNY